MGSVARQYDPEQRDDIGTAELSGPATETAAAVTVARPVVPAVIESKTLRKLSTEIDQLSATGAETSARINNESFSAPSASISSAPRPPSVLQFAPRIVRPPMTPAPRSRFIALQRWEGYVLERSDSSIIARLTDLADEGPEEEAEIPLEEIPPEDLPLVRPGAVFYWSIGYHDDVSGQRTRVSIIRFRRLPAWQPNDIKDALKEAAEMRVRLGWIE